MEVYGECLRNLLAWPDIKLIDHISFCIFVSWNLKYRSECAQIFTGLSRHRKRGNRGARLRDAGWEEEVRTYRDHERWHGLDSLAGVKSSPTRNRCIHSPRSRNKQPTAELMMNPPLASLAAEWLCRCFFTGRGNNSSFEESAGIFLHTFIYYIYIYVCICTCINRYNIKR